LRTVLDIFGAAALLIRAGEWSSEHSDALEGTRRGYVLGIKLPHGLEKECEEQPCPLLQLALSGSPVDGAHRRRGLHGHHHLADGPLAIANDLHRAEPLDSLPDEPDAVVRRGAGLVADKLIRDNALQERAAALHRKRGSSTTGR
jgi:hypothetical protein